MWRVEKSQTANHLDRHLGMLGPRPALLFTDIEGSTRLLEGNPEGYREALRAHHALLREVMAQHGGIECADEGDGLYLAFPRFSEAAAAAIAMQERLESACWPAGLDPLRVRMAVHESEAEWRDGQYRGPAVHFTARLLAAGHGGQVLAVGLPEEMRGRAVCLGTYMLRGFREPAEIWDLRGRAEKKPLRLDRARKHNLPPLDGPMVGREADLESLCVLLAPGGARWVSLVGPGGIGKTRLALALCANLLSSYDHGVLFVPMADRDEADALPFRILSAMGAVADEESDPLAQVLELLDGQPTLLFIDNVDQLAGGTSDVLARLTGSLEHLQILVTSRLPLGISGETVHRVPPLGLPREGASLEEVNESGAVQLFSVRAAKARSDFMIDSDSALTVAAICRLLDGLPLALELAAARLGVLTADELLGELKTGRGRGLEGVFEWSWRLLPEEIAGVLPCLAEFRGGWTAEAAASVGGLKDSSKALGILHYLLTCSLIRAEERAGAMRFWMLEPLRELAAEKLSDREHAMVVRRHREFFTPLAQFVAKETGKPGEAQFAGRIEVETPNILAAIAATDQLEERVRLALGFHRFAAGRESNAAIRARLEADLVEAGLSADLLVRGWNAVGHLAARVGELARAEQAFRNATEAAEHSGNRLQSISSRYNLAAILGRQGNREAAMAANTECLAFFREGGHRREMCVVLGNLAEDARRLGLLEQASAYVLEALEIARAENYSLAEGSLLILQGEILLARGDSLTALKPLAECLSRLVQSGRLVDLPEVLCPILCCLCGVSRWQEVALLLAATRNLIARHKVRVNPENAQRLEATARALESVLRETEQAEFFKQGRRLDPSGFTLILRELT